MEGGEVVYIDKRSETRGDKKALGV